jgi:prophage regulatory protein
MPSNRTAEDDPDPRRVVRGDNERRLRRIIRLPRVEEITGRKRSAIYEGIASGTFPAPVPLGARAVGWLEDEILDWQEHRIALRDERRSPSRFGRRS